MKKLSLREIQQYERDMLIEFDRFCKQNALCYMLGYGTLLGAVRHKGFIPWDDDIDVCMPRPDYERLLQMAPRLPEQTQHYMRLIHWRDGSSGYPFAKLLDDRIDISAYYMNRNNNSAKLWIDIFPIDGMPEDSAELKKMCAEEKKLERIVMMKHSRLGEGKNPVRKYAKYIARPFLNLLDDQKLNARLDKLARRYPFESSEWVGVILWGFGPDEKIRKSDMLRLIQLEFEGYRFFAPANYEEYLTQMYGEHYMELPPENERNTHWLEAWRNESA